MPSGLAIAGLVVSAIGTGVSIKEQQEQGELQQQANEEQRKIQGLQDARRNRQAVREARVARARVEQAEVLTGTAGGTSSQQALGSVQQQLGANLSFLDVTRESAERLTDISGQLIESQVRAGFGQAATQLGGSVFAAAGGFSSIFGGGTQQPPQAVFSTAAPSSSVPTLIGTR